MIDSEVAAKAWIVERFGNEVLETLEEFVGLLKAENEHQNLIASGSIDAIWRRHIVDSLQLLQHVPRGTEGAWLDLGSGAGFPGLVVSIATPDRQLVLVESRRKRVEWLQGITERFALTNCRVLGSRIESVDIFPAGVISARAFAPLPKLLAISARFSTPDTVWLLPKGRSAAQELADQPRPVRNLFHVEQSLTDAEAQVLVGKGIPPL